MSSLKPTDAESLGGALNFLRIFHSQIIQCLQCIFFLNYGVIIISLEVLVVTGAYKWADYAHAPLEGPVLITGHAFAGILAKRRQEKIVLYGRYVRRMEIQINRINNSGFGRLWCVCVRWCPTTNWKSLSPWKPLGSRWEKLAIDFILFYLTVQFIQFSCLIVLIA